MDPFERFGRWYRAAEAAGTAHPETMGLATSTSDGRPSVRMVLLKQWGPEGFVFFTDGRSRKGRELRENPRAALIWYWESVGRQVRVEGTVEPLPGADADAYWESRPRGSRLSAAASRQSAGLGERRELVARRAELAERHRGGKVPRPPAWGGFRVVPETIEFWQNRRDRLHAREVYERGRGARAAWRRRKLQP